MIEKYDDKYIRREWVHQFMKFDKDQLYEMNMGVLCGLSVDQLNLYANPKMNYLCMRHIKESLLELMPIEQVEVFANPSLNYFQMIILKDAFKKGLSIHEVRSIANPRFNYEQMTGMVDQLLKSKQ